MKALRLGTRGSALARAQSTHVADAFRAATGRPVELVEIGTAGDRSTAPVAQLGVGVFVSALRDALTAKEVDFAVHSYKDLPTAPAEARHHATRYYKSSNGVRYWRGSDGRYHCRRSNGTVGLVIGAAGGALVGRAIDTHGSRTTGTVIGAAAGALLGRSVARNNVRCR